MLKKTIKRLLRSADIFGVPIQFTLNRKYLQQSIFGGILSLVLFLIFFLLALQYFYDFIYNTDFFVNTQEQYSKNPPNINLASKKFNLALTFNDVRLNNFTFFQIDVIQATTEYNETKQTYQRKKKYLKTEKCTIDHFRDDLKADFLSLDSKTNFDTYFCISPDENLMFKGSFKSPDFSFFNIKISSCIQNESCASLEEIQKIFKENQNKVYFNIYLSNNIINTGDFNEPVSSFVEDKIYVLLDRQYYKEKNFYFTKNQLFTDKGLLFSDINEDIDTYAYNNKYDETTIKLDDTENNNLLAAIYLRSDSLSKNHFRSPMKFSKYVSYIGGFWSILHFLFCLVGKNYNSDKLTIKIANNVYEFNTSEENMDSKNHKNNKKVIKFNSKKQKISPDLSNYVKKLEKNISSKDEFPKRIMEFIENNKTIKLLYTWPYFLRFFLRKKPEKIKEREMQKNFRLLAKKAMLKDLDIVHFLKKFQTFEKIKNIVFSKDQIFMIEFFEKQSISQKQNSMSRSTKIFLEKLKKSKSYDQEYYSLDDYLKLFYSYKNLKYDNLEFSKNISKKILDGIKPEISKIFSDEDKKETAKNNNQKQHQIFLNLPFHEFKG